MVTIIANQLDNNYSQVQINALYTQCKKLIEDPFDFVVFVQDDEMKLLESTKKKDGYVDGITFHKPKYGIDWLEIDIMQHTNPNSSSLFITPNTIINNIGDIETYKTNKRVRLQDGNLAYFIFRNDNVEKILKEWEENEDDLLYEYDTFDNKFFIEEGTLPFLQDYTATYPDLGQKIESIVALPFWYEDFTEPQIELMYNKETDLYPWLPERIEINPIEGEDYLTMELVEDTFTKDYFEKAKIKRIHFRGMNTDPTLNPELFDICHFFMSRWGIGGCDITTDGKNNETIWWRNLGFMFLEAGNITFNINTGNPDKKILENAKALIETGCRVFWNYVHTNQLDSDIQKAKKMSEEYNFYGFIYDNQVPEEEKTIEKTEKPDMPDYKLIELETLQTRKKDDIYKERTIKFSPHVKCEGKVNNQFYLSATGNVFPCKHVALNLITAYNSPEHKTELLYSWNKNNIRENTLEEIFTNDFYKGYFNNLLKLNPAVIHNEQGGIC